MKLLQRELLLCVHFFVLHFSTYNLAKDINQGENEIEISQDIIQGGNKLEIYNQDKYGVVLDVKNTNVRNIDLFHDKMSFFAPVQQNVTKNERFPGNWVFCGEISRIILTPKIVIKAFITGKPIPDKTDIYECSYSRPDYVHLNSIDMGVTNIKLYCGEGYVLPSSILSNVTLERFTNLQVFFIGKCELRANISKAFLGVNKKLLYIVLDDNNITYIEPHAFDGLSNIVILGLARNNIERLPPGIFCKLTSLYYLDMYSNFLRTFPVDVFGNPSNNKFACSLQSLKYLDLSSNTLHQLPRHGFRFLTGLEQLIVVQCEIKSIAPLAFFGLLNLRKLYLSMNYLITIHEESFNGMPYLQLLHLNGNNITGTFSLKSMYALNELQIANLRLNQITSLSGNLNLVSNLKSLELDWNCFKELDATLSNSSSITVITISNNKIRNIGENGLKRLPNLAILDLSVNKLYYLAVSTFNGTPNMEQLNISNNALNFLPNGIFKSLQKLQDLDLSNNRIQTLPTTFFHGLLNLHVLNLKNNYLHHMDEELFYTLKESVNFDKFTGYRYRNLLKILDISNNGAVVNSNHIKGSFNLEEFWCANNYIGNFTTNFFQHMNKLKILDISGNNITHLSFIEHLYNQTETLEYLDASRNFINSFGFSGFSKVVLPSLLYLNLARNHLVDIANYSRCVQCYPNLEVFDISHNNIIELPEIWKWGELPLVLNLKYINISNSIVTLTSPMFFALFGRLEYIDLSYNRMTDMVKPRFLLEIEHELKINAKENPFVCTCMLRWYRSRREEAEQTHCSSPVTGKHMPLTSIPLNEFLCEIRENCPSECTCLYDYYRVEDATYIYVKCVNQKLTSLPSHLPNNTEGLNLANNHFPILPANMFKSTFLLRKLDISYCGIGHINNSSFGGLFKLKELNLAGNYLKLIEARWLTHLIWLERLFLHDNRIAEVSNDSLVTVRTLSYLTLHNNRLATLNPSDVFRMSYVLSTLSLGFNPWNCSCHAYNLQEWLRFHQDIVLDLFNVLCSSPRSLQILSVIHANITKCPRLDISNNWEIITFSASGGFLFIIIILVSLIYFRGEIRVLLHARYGWRFSLIKEDESKIFDAFVSYSNADESFVVHTLAPRLEQYGFKLFLHYKHFVPGATISENIIDGVHNSKRTLILLSKNFLKSEWCNFEFKTAHYQMITDKCSRVVVILLDQRNALENLLDNDLNLYLNTNTYIEKNQKLFWEKLIFSLPTLHTCTRKVKDGEVKTLNNLNVESTPLLSSSSKKNSSRADRAFLIN